MYSQVLVPEIMSTILPEDFPADRLSKPQYRVKVEKDVYVRMRDGVQVCVDIYRPDDPGPFPALLASSPYQKDLYYLPSVPSFHMRETNKIDWFVERGYVFILHDTRGSGKSEGEWRFFDKKEQTDMYDLIEWIAVQPWCSGKVGMIGESYYAMVQWFAAALQPPHLACIVPFDAVADLYRDMCYHGGILVVGFVAGWNTTEIRGHHMLPHKKPRPMTYDMAFDVLSHPTFDDYWTERSPDLSKIKCPVYSVGILHKVSHHMRGNVRGYEEVKVPKKLMLCHGDFEGDEMRVFESEEIRMELLRWYDHWLKENDTGMMKEPPVNLFIRGAERYRRENEWPLARTQYTNLYLDPGPSGSVESLNDGGLSFTPPEQGKSSFEYVYPDPDWTGFSGIGTAVIEKGLLHPTKKILTFTSDPLKEDLEIAGSIVLKLFSSSTEEDQEFLVRLWDQLPDSEQKPGILPPMGRILVRGWLKASHREKDERLSRSYRPYYKHTRPTPIEPGKIYEYDVELWPTCNLFKKGHRIRLDLACGDSNAFDFGGHYYGLKVGRDTVYHEKDHPSHLVLPVIPRK